MDCATTPANYQVLQTVIALRRKQMVNFIPVLAHILSKYDDNNV